MESLGQARQRRIGLAAEIRRQFAPELRVFCDMDVSALPELATTMASSLINPEVSYSET